MKLTVEQVQEILEAAKPDIIAGLKSEIASSAVHDIKYEAAKEISAVVKKFVADEIVPEVQRHLIASKEGLIALAVPLSEAIVAALVEKLSLDVKKNLEQSWTRGEIVKKLFT